MRLGHKSGARVLAHISASPLLATFCRLALTQMCMVSPKGWGFTPVHRACPGKQPVSDVYLQRGQQHHGDRKD